MIECTNVSSDKKKSVARRIEDLCVAQMVAADETLRKPSQLDILDRFVTPVPALGVSDAARLGSLALRGLNIVTSMPPLFRLESILLK